jgi:5-methylcytosine-specific restriction endonuclease McrA
MDAAYKKRNIVGWDENRLQANPWYFKRLKNLVENEFGRGKKPEVDHIVPIALGGDTVGFDNHQILCYDCHKCKTKVDIGAIAQMKRDLKEKLETPKGELIHYPDFGEEI